ncbi:MAG: thioesterase family protein [Cyanobacteriota bacterium]|nr:thioesterase family protein [Cyanobacteriota bacterium]
MTEQLESERSSSLATEPNWFEYSVRAHPHHTDFAGIVWHGTYIAWMEEARVEYLRASGIEFADLVAVGCDLPVVELSVRYHQSMGMGTSAVVKAYMEPPSGVRLNWKYQIRSPDGQILYLSAIVTLVAVDRQKGKIMRRLPPSLERILADRSTAGES